MPLQERMKLEQSLSGELGKEGEAEAPQPNQIRPF